MVILLAVMMATVAAPAESLAKAASAVTVTNLTAATIWCAVKKEYRSSGQKAQLKAFTDEIRKEDPTFSGAGHNQIEKVRHARPGNALCLILKCI